MGKEKPIGDIRDAEGVFVDGDGCVRLEMESLSKSGGT